MPKFGKQRVTKLARNLATPYSHIAESVRAVSRVVNSVSKENCNPSVNSDAISLPLEAEETLLSKLQCLADVNNSANKFLKKHHVENSPIVQDDLEKSVLSRGQRKRQIKKERFQRRYNFASYIKELREEEIEKKKYGALADFSEMSKTLDTVPISSTSLNETKKKKKVKTIAPQQAIDKYQAILDFPQFKENPMGAIRKHLINTLNKNDTIVKIN